jgi:hypothetical protein
MASAEQYRFYAEQCLRWADEAANAADREIFFEMANVWTQLELSADSGVSNGQSSPSPVSRGAQQKGRLEEASLPIAPEGHRAPLSRYTTSSATA